MLRCAFCGAGTDFINHSEHLCLSCGDMVMQYQPEQIVEMAKSFGKCLTLLRKSMKASDEMLAIVKDVTPSTSTKNISSNKDTNNE